jgi:Uma2 family endonuclease
LETTQHRIQMNMLIESLQEHLEAAGVTAYVAGNNFLYYRRRPPGFVGPDVYVVLGRRERFQRSYVVWEEEGRYPDVVIELLSESTERIDRGVKRRLYQTVFRTPEYYLYDPLDGRFEGYRLRGARYAPIRPGPTGLLPCRTLGLALGRWEGWLRWFTREGHLLPTARERADQERARADQERARAEQERARAEQERARAERLAARLRALGLDE